MNINNLSLGAKLWLAVVFLIVFLGAVLGVSNWQSRQSQARADAALMAAEQKLTLAIRWSGLTEAAVGRTLMTAATTDLTVVNAVNKANADAIATITDVQKALKESALDDGEKAQMQKIAELRKVLLDETVKVAKVKDDPNTPNEQRIAAAESIGKAAAPYLASLKDFVALQERRLVETRAQAAADRHDTLLIAAAMIAVLLVLTIAGAWLLIRSIRQPLADARALAARIAAGDLTVGTQSPRGDEFGDLMRSLHAMSDSLARTVGEVRQAADTIATGSTQIATGNADLSHRTEQQASNLQETAASMEQLTSTVKNSADTARQASDLASSARHVAAEGGEVVGRVVHTMEEISAASRKIGEIIGVIDGIAFQTNILALNAAVESARAGEHGKGFAVVAAEVRHLAQRSAEAARQIKDLIHDSVAKVEAGSEQVGRAGRTMQDIVQQVKRVSDLIGNISVATTEQTQGITQVGDAVNQLDQVTQQNAALVEQSAAAADTLSRQAARLVQAVSVFQLSQAQSMSVIAAAQASSRTEPALRRPALAPAPAAAAAAPAARSHTAATPPSSQAKAEDEWQAF